MTGRRWLPEAVALLGVALAAVGYLVVNRPLAVVGGVVLLGAGVWGWRRGYVAAQNRHHESAEDAAVAGLSTLWVDHRREPDEPGPE